MEERLRALQRAVAMLETEKKDAERQAVRLEKDKDALRNTLDKVSKSKLKSLICYFSSACKVLTFHFLFGCQMF